MKSRIALLVACLCFCAWAAVGQSVYVNFDRNLNFSKYHTYAWGQESNPNQIKSPFVAREVKLQIDLQLTNRGFPMVEETQGPDLIVVASGGLQVGTSYNAWNTGWWRGPTWVTPLESTIGTLIVDLYDARVKELAWRGMARATLSDASSEQNMRLVDKAVAKIFKKFPPQ